MQESLLDLLSARHGIVCAVGAGGKKTVLQHLAAAHPGRVALTGTVVVTHFPPSLGFDVVLGATDELPARIAAHDRSRSVAYACPIDKPGRHGGVPADVIERIHRELGFAATYVKADGARMRWIKAPEDNEPAVPAGCSTVIAVVSARCLGEPLGPRVAHRIERVQEVTGLEPGETIRPEHVARLIASPQGLRKGLESQRIVPVINMVDDAERESLARAAATMALELEPEVGQVVLTSLHRREEPVVAVIRRRGRG